MNQVDKLVKAFRTITQNPTPVSGTILNITGSRANILSIWSQRNLERKATIQLQVAQSVDLARREVCDLGSIETTSEILATNSPSGMYRGLFRESPAMGKTPKKQFLEVWKENKLWKVIDVTALEAHGDVYADNDFGTFEWSPLEDKVLYVAEKKVPKSESFVGAKTLSKKTEDGVRGAEYLLVEDWGEALVGKSQPVLAVAQLDGEGDVKVISSSTQEDDELCFGQGVWAPDGGIVGVAWSSTPRRLGLVYCSNRLSWIVHISPEGDVRKISGEGLSVRSPQFSHDCKSLVWLERPVGGPHHACQRLMKYDWYAKYQSTVIDIIEEATKCENDAVFYGLYNFSLKHCWLPDNKTLVISTPQRVSVKTFIIDTESRKICELRPGGHPKEISQCLLDNKGGSLLVWRSSLTTSSGLYLLPAPPSVANGISSAGLLSAAEEDDSWLPLIHCQPLSFSNSYEVEIFDLIAPNNQSADPVQVRDFCAIYLGPKTGKDVPLVVWPHGGPHSSFMNTFSLMASLFASIGFAMVMVNYRGSIGQGQASIDHLLGKVGFSDVADMQQAATHALSSKSCLSQEKTLLFGASHGGFLVLHLSAQFPKAYRSCVAINPVTDLTLSGSDIPDWAMTEAGYKWLPTSSLDGSMYEKMKDASPLSRVDNVVAPTLLLLGKKDLRVPSYHGLNYYHALKARHVKTKVLMYEDSHSLLQTMHEADFAINSILWFLESIDHEIEFSDAD